jgi:hypothetical protein
MRAVQTTRFRFNGAPFARALISRVYHFSPARNLTRQRTLEVLRIEGNLLHPWALNGAEGCLGQFPARLIQERESP